MSSLSSTTNARTGIVSRIPRWARIVIVILALALVAFAAMMIRMNYVPTDLNTATTQFTEGGSYQVSYDPGQAVIPINQIQMWTIRVMTPDGQPVEDAEITVDGGMPQHGHGLPTAPQVTEYLGDGQYRVEGMKFNMPGWWVIKFDITRNGAKETVTFNLTLD